MHAMQAIQTTYYGPGNVRGAAIGVKARAGRGRVHYNHGLSVLGNHVAAAKAFATKLGWHGNWFCGGLSNGDYVFVCANFRDVDGVDERAAFSVAKAD